MTEPIEPATRRTTVTPASDGSPARAVGMGIFGAAVGLAVFLLLAIVFSFTAGLVVVAIFTGRFVGLFVRAGAAGSLSSPARTVVALVIFLIGMTLALGITWLVAGLQGGVLSFGAFLDETYGTPLIALEYMLGTLMTWWSAK